MTNTVAPVRAVVFGMEGVLAQPDPEREERFRRWVYDRTRLMSPPFEQGRQQTETRMADSDARAEIRDGVSETAYWRYWWRDYLERLGIDDEDDVEDARLQFVYYRMQRLAGTADEVLAKLNRGGFKLGVVSNGFPSLSDALEYLEVRRFFDAVVDSTSAGAHKPDPVIFQQALQQLGVAAPNTLYVDCDPDDLRGAYALGMHILRLDRSLVGHDLRQRASADLTGVLAYIEALWRAGIR